METELKPSDYVCKQANCKFPIDGQCIDSLPPPKKCPNRSLATSETTQQQSDAEVAGQSESVYVNTHKGEALTEDNCNALMAGVEVKLIILAGLKDSGKSTLLGSLFQLFQDNSSFAGHTFAGSLTIVGFERICHDSRMSSERESPHTQRTVQGFDGILHLKTKAQETDAKKEDLIFTNLSGEDFEDLGKSTEFCKRFTIAKRANHFSLFIDAGLLSKVEARHAAKTDSINVLMGLLDAGMISPTTKIDIIYSRWDLFLDASETKKHRQFIDQIQVDLINRLKPYNLEVNFFEVASRPSKSTTLEFGYGLNKLFVHWATSTNRYLPIQVDDKPLRIPSREFSKYLFENL